MSEKKRSRKGASPRSPSEVQVVLPRSLVTALDEEVHRERRSGKKSGRTAVLREIITSGLAGRRGADSLVKEASAAEADGRTGEARRLYLAAAAREIEAMASMSPGNEVDLKSAVLLAVHHLKKGTGYSRLPEVQVRFPKGPEVDQAQ